LAISAVDSINPAFEHAKRQLLRPFRFGQWTRLAFVGLLAGELSSGGSCNFRMPGMPAKSGGGHPSPWSHFPLHSIHPALLAGLIALLAVAVLVLWLLFLYLSSVMRFVLFDSVVEGECHIGKGWRRRQGPGLRYFVWMFVISLASMAVITIFAGVPLAIAFAMGWLKNPGQHLLPLILGGIALFFLLMAFFIGMLILAVLSKDFLVPQMALENINAFEAWRRLWAMLKREKGGYAGYLGMKVVMSIGAGIIVGIVSVGVMLVILIPVGGLGVVAVLAGNAAGLTWNVYSITLAIVVGSMVILLLMYLLALISVPLIVFFPAYSIYFFASRYPPLAAVLYPAPAAPPGPPPFQPEPQPIL
jgi:hypothetical protein